MDITRQGDEMRNFTVNTLICTHTHTHTKRQTVCTITPNNTRLSLAPYSDGKFAYNLISPDVVLLVFLSLSLSRKVVRVAKKVKLVLSSTINFSCRMRYMWQISAGTAGTQARWKAPDRHTEEKPITPGGCLPYIKELVWEHPSSGGWAF